MNKLKYFYFCLPGLIFLGLVLVFGVPATPAGAEPEQAASITWIDTIPYAGEIGALAIDCSGPSCSRQHDLMILTYDNSSWHVRFLDTVSRQMGPGYVDTYMVSTVIQPAMLYDRYHNQAYVYVQASKSEHGKNWEQAILYRVARRQLIGWLPVNDAYNVGKIQPDDTWYNMDGMTIWQSAGTEGYASAVFLDNTIGGNIDHVTFNARGDEFTHTGRFSYRDAKCAPGTAICTGIHINEGNSLALDRAVNTREAGLRSDVGRLYIADGPDKTLRVFGVGAPGALGGSFITDINYSGAFLCTIGTRGVAVAEARDVLYMASGCQDGAAEGSIASWSTISHQFRDTITFLYRDLDDVLVDWYDDRRVFVASSNALVLGAPGVLLVHFFYDDALVQTVTVMNGFGPTSKMAMTFDPYHRRLYVAAEGFIYVYQVNYGMGPATAGGASGSGVITSAGGNIYTQDGSASLEFPTNAVTATVEVNYAEGSPHSTRISTGGSHLHAIRTFEIAAVLTDTTPLPETSGGYYIKSVLTPNEIMPVNLDDLTLYWWNGNTWESQFRISYLNQELTTWTQKTGLFALMGPVHAVFLPLVMK